MKHPFLSAVLATATFLTLTVAPAAAQYSSPMRDVDNPARQPFAITKNVVPFFGTATSLDASNPVLTVPAGKRLVIETVSVNANLQSGQVGLARIGTTAGGGGASFIFPLAKTYNYTSLGTNFDIYPIPTSLCGSWNHRLRPSLTKHHRGRKRGRGLRVLHFGLLRQSALVL